METLFRANRSLEKSLRCHIYSNYAKGNPKRYLDKSNFEFWKQTVFIFIFDDPSQNHLLTLWICFRQILFTERSSGRANGPVYLSILRPGLLLNFAWTSSCWTSPELRHAKLRLNFLRFDDSVMC